ncbi:MAG TPA: wax ester/triacylglycerol synthase family O-acyltransferase [Nocardioides sp.]|uniref:WS/DGAT/MGAT family O-acyltransferase n=1 Tax=Nocardioides sp. TaxID=35761 RepID=UPI002ED9D225
MGGLAERLTPRDLAFLIEEQPTAPRHNATVEIFEAPDGGAFDYDQLVALIADRIAFVPRYRQRVQWVPGRLANPMWVDDPGFDLEYHVRRSALPRPGDAAQLRDLVARIVSRPLDRQRPLWEIYLVEGLEGGRVAILTKAHNALVDGVHTVDLGQLLLDVTPAQKPVDDDDVWNPQRRPTAAGLVLGAVRDSLSDPATVVATARGVGATAGHRARRTSRKVLRSAEAVLGTQERPTPVSGRLSQQRRFATVDATLADLRTIRAAHGGTINDVVLAVVAGGLRGWLMARAESLAGLRRIRAVVPISVIDENEEATSLGSQIAAHFVDLPVGEASPVVRLHQVSYSFETHRATGRGVAASRLTGIAGFAPTTFHAVGSRVAASQPHRSFQISVTNVPGPQSPRYAAGARMVASYPVHPLLPGHPLAIGVTSYDGRVFFGITADRDLVPDADILGQCVAEALDELVDTATGARPRAPRGRRRATPDITGKADRA